ncbi:MAG: ATP-binding protein [Bacteroidales bacterium]|nr:ATP-binding protein [Bacteroidales bacterium]
MKDLSLHILDIVQNSIRAEAGTIQVELVAGTDGKLKMLISDDGKGMDEEQVNRVKDPFFTTRTTRKIGLGISLLTQKAEQSGGYLTIESTPGKGTEVKAVFEISHPDCPPLGDIPGCAWMLMASNPGLRLIFRLVSATEEYEWDSNEINDALGGLPLTEHDVQANIIEWFNADFSKFKEFND